jgi:hypothetical protein
MRVRIAVARHDNLSPETVRRRLVSSPALKRVLIDENGKKLQL